MGCGWFGRRVQQARQGGGHWEEGRAQKKFQGEPSTNSFSHQSPILGSLQPNPSQDPSRVWTMNPSTYGACGFGPHRSFLSHGLAAAAPHERHASARASAHILGTGPCALAGGAARQQQYRTGRARDTHTHTHTHTAKAVVPALDGLSLHSQQVNAIAKTQHVSAEPTTLSPNSNFHKRQ